ncbi:MULTISPECIES: ABC transporter ATP-binding protein [Chlamydia]|uniref:ABC transporter ATP-binding protein n=1 Tax=Chlamydophila parapsittaci TaxID=344886 RepID=A0ABX5VWR3_9CHLA|nr:MULTISPECIES: ABC transporter ATP-binding protein [Chlamydia]EPJ33842.1 ABC transporter family protein [Chlamydia psittaci 06-1683]EPP31600.1 ABC transporter family protein [Chlamydia psittaci C1/97]AFS20715.1 ABC transporter family protein [Chlamydia psittaci GR9]AFS23898.1 ABC transporter family protein [Chlamydia psittaci WS/RT/E30]EPP28219.1 ABC transporter family protein [Chlamydia psittaci 08-2626_L3]
MLEVKSLSYSYSDKLIFRNASFVSHPGKITIILGVSGTGKTTLFRLIANFLSPAEGEILWLGEPVQQTDVAYMQQKHTLLPWRTVLKNIHLNSELGGKHKRFRISSEKLLEVVESFNLGDLLDCYPDELSEGQKQRVSLACQCLSPKPILLLDEPFSSLDITTKEQLYKYILRLARKDYKTVILVTHDFRDVAFLGDAFYVLKNHGLVPVFFNDLTRSTSNVHLLIEDIRECLST